MGVVEPLRFSDRTAQRPLHGVFVFDRVIWGISVKLFINLVWLLWVYQYGVGFCFLCLLLFGALLSFTLRAINNMEIVLAFGFGFCVGFLLAFHALFDSVGQFIGWYELRKTLRYAQAKLDLEFLEKEIEK